MEYEVVCNKCEETFDLKGRIKTEKLELDYERIYFSCPNCETKYTISYTNKKVRDIQLKWHEEGAIHGTPTHKALRIEAEKINNYLKFRYK